jgi:hypothetical protein
MSATIKRRHFRGRCCRLELNKRLTCSPMEGATIAWLPTALAGRPMFVVAAVMAWAIAGDADCSNIGKLSAFCLQIDDSKRTG